MPSASPASFSAIAEELLGEPDIEEGTGFGKNSGLRSGGSIFAMLVRDELVVKLPAARCAELVDAGDARTFEVGRRQMREWVSIRTAAQRTGEPSSSRRSRSSAAECVSHITARAARVCVTAHVDPDAVQWMLVCELVRAHPETITVGALHELHPRDDVEEAVARLQIDGLAVRFGDWVKASEPAVRFDQLARSADLADVHAIGRRAAW